MPAIVISGDEELRICERAAELKEKLLDPAWASFNFSAYNQPELKEIVDAAACVPFGPGNKVILFEQCELFTKKRGGKAEDEPGGKAKGKPEKLLEDLDRALLQMAPNTYLLICCTAKFDKTLRVSKVFEKHAEIEEFEKFKFFGGPSAEMMNWCRKRAHKKYDAVIDDEAIHYLAESYEGNLRQVAMEIEKAAVYVLPEKHISLKTVSELSPHYSSVFALLDHWVEGDKYQVISSIDELLAKQEPVIRVFALLQTVFSKWLSIKAASEKVLASMPAGRGIQRRELPPADMVKRIQAELKVNPWTLRNDLERVNKLKLERLVEKKLELTRLENMLKSGSISDRNAITIFFAG